MRDVLGKLVRGLERSYRMNGLSTSKQCAKSRCFGHKSCKILPLGLLRKEEGYRDGG